MSLLILKSEIKVSRRKFMARILDIVQGDIICPICVVAQGMYTCLVVHINSYHIYVYHECSLIYI